MMDAQQQQPALSGDNNTATAPTTTTKTPIQTATSSATAAAPTSTSDAASSSSNSSSSAPSASPPSSTTSPSAAPPTTTTSTSTTTTTTSASSTAAATSSSSSLSSSSLVPAVGRPKPKGGFFLSRVWSWWGEERNKFVTGQHKCYFDNNASTPLDPEVQREMSRILTSMYGNASSLHTYGREARGVIDSARCSIASILGCSPHQLTFTSGGTEANNTVVKGVWMHALLHGNPRLGKSAQPGFKGHIVTSAIEHDSILGSCMQECLCRDGRVKVEDIIAAIRDDTVLVTVMHANNETGAVQPIKEIAAACKERGILMHTDLVQSFCKLPVNVQELGVDFATITAHKINGPKGCGALFWRGVVSSDSTPTAAAHIIVEGIDPLGGWFPLIYGGHQERELRSGTEAVHQIAGFALAAKLAHARMTSEFSRLQALRAKLISGISAIDSTAFFSEASPDHQLPGTVNVTFPGQEGIKLLAGLDCYEICVSIGSACTADRIEPSHVLLGMGLTVAEALSSIRISMGCTTTVADIDYFLHVLPIILRGYPPTFAWLDPKHLDASRLASTFVCDVRFSFERLTAPSAPGAHEFSFVDFDRYFDSVPWDREVILMCTTGIMSFSAGYRLAAAGHPQVRVVFGGYAAWKALHGNLLTGAPSLSSSVEPNAKPMTSSTPSTAPTQTPTTKTNQD
ncbi:cysteine desulfurase NifS [Pelomyxa schiedti]|nr:cysteine desulfurase NifS [Pelomyxa schiedti]